MHNKYETLFISSVPQFQLNQSSVIPFYPFLNVRRVKTISVVTIRLRAVRGLAEMKMSANMV